MSKLARAIWFLLAVHLAVGACAFTQYLLTRQYTAVTFYFALEGVPFFMLMTGVECSLAFRCALLFERDEPMRLAWLMIAMASLARFAGTTLRSMATLHFFVPGFGWLDAHPIGPFHGLDQIGLIVGSPLSMVLLAIGLGRVLGIQHRLRVIGSLTRGDQALLAIIGAFTISQIGVILPLFWQHPALGTMLMWPSDPLLSLLLIQAVLIRRTVVRMGGGLVAQCWSMYVVGIVLTSVGDAGIWAISHSYLPDPLVVLSWYLWFVPAAAFASAPALQLSAMALAHQSAPMPFEQADYPAIANLTE